MLWWNKSWKRSVRNKSTLARIIHHRRNSSIKITTEFSLDCPCITSQQDNVTPIPRVETFFSGEWIIATNTYFLQNWVLSKLGRNGHILHGWILKTKGSDFMPSFCLRGFNKLLIHTVIQQTILEHSPVQLIEGSSEIKKQWFLAWDKCGTAVTFTGSEDAICTCTTITNTNLFITSQSFAGFEQSAKYGENQ